MNRLRTIDYGQQTFSGTELRHRYLPIAHCSLLIAIIFVLCSCSTSKNASNIRTLSANHIIRGVENNKFEFNSLETKLNVKIKGDNNIGLKGQLRMQNDSIIWISLSLIGIEVGRVMITNDSVKFINRSNKTYLAESLDNFKEKLPNEVTIHFLQDLLVGNNQLSQNNKFNVTIENDCYILASNTNDLWVTPETFKVKKYELHCLEQQIGQWSESMISVNYDNFQKINDKLLPTKIILDTNNLGLNIEIDYSEIKVGEALDFPFNISKKFNKIKL